jgi:hypothetical protein
MDSRIEFFVNSVMGAEAVADVPIIRIDNVAEYLERDTTRTYYTFEELPNLAPPWPIACFIWRGRHREISYEAVVIMFGWQISSGWLLNLRIWVLHPGQRNSAFGNVYHLLDSTGVHQDPPLLGLKASAQEAGIGDWLAGLPDEMDSYIRVAQLGMYDWDQRVFDFTLEGETLEQVCVRIDTVEFPILSAITFCHCKNVELIEELPARALRRRREAAHLPAIKFRTINIQPVRQMLVPHTSQGETISHALHICRGHFKDYRQRGLFGRNKGLYWWDMHMRGSIEQGRVVKDYSIQP